MRLALLSDIHGNIEALRAVFGIIRGQVDHILFLGDLVGYYGFVNECVDLWDGPSTTAVLGNHDQLLLDFLSGTHLPNDYRTRYGSALERTASELSPSAAYLLSSWPREQRLCFESTSIAMFHGAPWNPLGGRVYPDSQEWPRFDEYADPVILLGHTHYQFAREWNDKFIINPGSVGQARDRSGAAAYAILELPTRKLMLHRVPYDCTAIIADVRKHDPDLSSLVEVLRR